MSKMSCYSQIVKMRKVVLCAPSCQTAEFHAIWFLFMSGRWWCRPQTSHQSCLHVWDRSCGCTAWRGWGWAHSPEGLRCWALEWRRCDQQSHQSGICLWRCPVVSVFYCRYGYFWHTALGSACRETRAADKKPETSETKARVRFEIAQVWSMWP